MNHESAGQIPYEEYNAHEACEKELQTQRAIVHRYQENERKTGNDLEKAMNENQSLKSKIEQLQSILNKRSQARRGEVDNPSFHRDSESDIPPMRTREKYESMYTQLPRSIKYVTVEMALMAADASLILRDWKDMEQHCTWALKEASDLHDQPLTSLCHFTMGIALYHQRKWGLAFEAFSKAGPCKEVHKTFEEVEEWQRKAQRAGEASSAASAFPSSSGPVSAMPMSSVPRSGASVTTPQKWESLADFDSAGPVSGQTPGTPWNHQERERRTQLASEGPAAEELSSTYERRDFALSSGVMPSLSNTSISENNIVQALDPNSSSPNDNINTSSELKIPRPSPFHSSSLILNAPIFPRSRSPLYVPSSTPSPPLTRHPSPLVQTQKNPDRSTNSPFRSQSPLTQAHSHLDPSNLSHDEILHIRRGQRLNVPQIQSPRSRRGIERQLHSNKVPKKGIMKRRSTTTGERPAAVEEEDEDNKESDAAVPTRGGQVLHPEPRRGHKRQQSRSFSGASNATWDNHATPTVQSQVDQIVGSRADVLRQWRTLHPNAMDRSHLVAESERATEGGNRTVVDRDCSSPTNRRRRRYKGGESDISSESSPPDKNEQIINERKKGPVVVRNATEEPSSGRSEDRTTTFTAKTEQLLSTRPRLGAELWSPNDADDEKGDMSGGSGNSPSNGGRRESGANGDSDESGARTETVVDEDSPGNSENDESDVNDGGCESDASTKAVVDSDSPYNDESDKSAARTKIAADSGSSGNGGGCESDASTKTVIDSDSPGNGGRNEDWSDEIVADGESYESDASTKTVINAGSSEYVDRTLNSDAWFLGDEETNQDEKPGDSDEEVRSSEKQERTSEGEKRSESSDNTSGWSRNCSHLEGDRSETEEIEEEEETGLSEGNNHSELSSGGSTSPNNRNNETDDNELFPQEEPCRGRSSK